MPNPTIDGTYVYRTARYGDGALMVKKNEVLMAAGLPTIISPKLEEYWKTAKRDGLKCYSSFSEDQILAAKTLLRFLRYTLFNDLLLHYEKLPKGRQASRERRVYSTFLLNLFKLLNTVTKTYFQPSQDAIELNQRRPRSKPQSDADKDSKRALKSALIQAGLWKYSQDEDGNQQGEDGLPIDQEEPAPPERGEDDAGYGIGSAEFAQDLGDVDDLDMDPFD